MYIHVQRQFSTKRKGCEFCFDLNTFTYVSSTKRDSVVGVEIRVDGEVDGWEARRGPGGRLGLDTAALLPPFLPPRFSGPLQSPWRLRRLLIPQDGLWFAPDLAGCVWSHSVRCWKGYIHPLFAGACGSLTCCSVRRLPEDISAPAASPAAQFPWSCAVQSDWQRNAR